MPAEIKIKDYSAMIILFLCLCLTGFLLLYNFYGVHRIFVVEDGQKQTVYTKGKTVAEALAYEGISILPQDKVTPTVDTPVQNGLEVDVDKAVNVLLLDGGKGSYVRSSALSVAGFLGEQNLTLSPKDELRTPLSSALKEGSVVEICRRASRTEVVQVALSPETVIQNDNTLARGIQRVVTTGRAGYKQITYEINYENGKEVSREAVASQVVVAPRNHVVARGTLTTHTVNGGSFTFTRAIVVQATAYTGGGVTASGRRAQVGVIAVDPSIIPYGTKVYVEGYGYAIAGDTGGRINGDRIDVYLETERACRNWGVRYVKIYLGVK